jgi:type I restriction enzyme, S subunit
MSWPKVALGEICIVDWGNTSLTKSSYVAGGEYLAVSATGGDGRIDHWDHKALTPVISAIGAQCGKLFLPKEDFTAIKNTITLTPIDDKRSQEACCPIYLYHLLSSMQLPRRGAGQPFISKGDLEKFKIPLPPLEEQRRIAAILDKASRIAELCGTALKLSHAADKSLFLHFFADLPEESDFLLEELADKRSNAIRTGPFGSQLLHGEFTDSGIAVLGIDNAVTNSFEWSKRRFISHEKYEQLKRYTVFPGDLIITIMGTCGRAAVVPDDIPEAINTKHLCAISVDRSVVLPEYLHSYILFHPSASRYLSQRTKGAIMEGLNMTIIKELPVAVPPVSDQMAWLARRKILRAASKRAQSMSASALSLRQSFSYNLLEERGA